jgi:polyphosphate glucokinase
LSQDETIEVETVLSSAMTAGAIGYGIDIGGSGMKASKVDLSTGELVADRFRVATPSPATPAALAEVVPRLIEHHGWTGSIGVCFPAVVKHGVARSAANIDDSWIGVDVDALFTSAAGVPVSLMNDADAAGLAEMTWGAGRGRRGVVICITLGTGIGSGMFIDGTLVPNTELGHLELDGEEAENRAAASARTRDHLSWEKWGKRVDRYLKHVEFLFSPELIILGGGVSKKPEKWFKYIELDCDVEVAQLENNAGIAGAALHAAFLGESGNI